MQKKEKRKNLVTKLVVILDYNPNIFLLKMDFDKSTIGLYLLLISSMLAKFLGN